MGVAEGIDSNYQIKKQINELCFKIKQNVCPQTIKQDMNHAFTNIKSITVYINLVRMYSSNIEDYKYVKTRFKNFESGWKINVGKIQSLINYFIYGKVGLKNKNTIAISFCLIMKQNFSVWNIWNIYQKKSNIFYDFFKRLEFSGGFQKYL